jgi:hypothetical protein
MVSMLEKVISYVKFLQLKVKVRISLTIARASALLLNN